MKHFFSRHDSPLVVAGCFSALLGALVILGWHSHSISLVKIRPFLAPMTYNAAWAFLLAGLGYLAVTFRQPVIARLCGTLVFAIGILTLAEYLSGKSIGIDQLIVQDTFSVNIAYPGRMAINTAFNFTLAGIVLWLMGKRVKPEWYPGALGYLGLIIATFGLISIMGYTAGFSGAYRWGGSHIIGMALHTAFGFAVIGISTVMFAWQSSKADSGVSDDVIRIQFNSIETRLTLVFLLLAIVPTITVSVVAHNIVFEHIKAERVKSVGQVADAKHEQLVMVLTRANDRAKSFLSNLTRRCNTGKLNQACAARLIESYLALEGAEGAQLHRKGAVSLTVGAAAALNGETAAFKTGQLAKFSGTGRQSNRSYLIRVAEPSNAVRLAIYYPSSNLQQVFDRPDELGESGETFLTDGEGYFVTKAKYPSMQGHDMPIHARPMILCLGGKNTEVLDLDYRDAEIIHGFRLVPEFGSACIMAHIDQAEAFAPLVALENKLFIFIVFLVLLVLLAAMYMASKMARPIKRLTSVARAISHGDYLSQANEEGADEVAELATSFNAMTGQLFSSNARLKQKNITLAESYKTLQQFSLHLDNVRGEERVRIAREIHDEMGATLTVLKMRVHALRSTPPTGMAQLTAEAEYMDKLVADTIHTMHHVVSQLMPTQLLDLGFAAAIERYVKGFQKNTGIECSFVLPEEGLALNDNLSSAMFRILQESLNNVAKHAQATRASILFIERNHSLILLIKDNGTGFDTNARKHNSFGLLGITERARMVNGKVRISSKPGRGTQVLISFRLRGNHATQTIAGETAEVENCVLATGDIEIEAARCPAIE